MSINAYPGPLRRVNFGWINESFQLFQRDGWIWAFAVFIYSAIGGVIGGGTDLEFVLTGHPLTYPVDPMHPSLSPFAMFTPAYFQVLGINTLIGLPLTGFFMGGLFRMANKSVRGQPLDISDLFSGGPTVLSFILLYIVFGILLYIGFGCGLIFGGFVVMSFLFPAFSLLADGEGVSSALSKSFNGVKQDWLQATALTFVFCLLYIGTGCCIVPIFVTIPMGFIISALACRDLINGPAPQVQAYVAPPGSWPPPPNVNANVYSPPPAPTVWPPKSEPVEPAETDPPTEHEEPSEQG